MRLNDMAPSARELALSLHEEVEWLRGELARLRVKNATLKQSITALIEVYAPHERKPVLTRLHLSE